MIFQNCCGATFSNWIFCMDRLILQIEDQTSLPRIQCTISKLMFQDHLLHRSELKYIRLRLFVNVCILFWSADTICTYNSSQKETFCATSFYPKVVFLVLSKSLALPNSIEIFTLKTIKLHVLKTFCDHLTI